MAHHLWMSIGTLRTLAISRIMIRGRVGGIHFSIPNIHNAIKNATTRTNCRRTVYSAGLLFFLEGANIDISIKLMSG
jgi:hypothetical protein